jgi:hypothetical protein
VPVHTYMLAQHGVPILELVELEALARYDPIGFDASRPPAASHG